MEQRQRAIYDSDLQIELLQFWNLTHDFPAHFHDYYVFGYAVEGSRIYYVKNKRFTLQSDTAFIFNPFEEHHCEQAGNEVLTYSCVNVRPNVLSNFLTEIGFTETDVKFQNQIFDKDFIRRLDQLTNAITDNEDKMEKEECFIQFLDVLLKAHQKDDVIENDKRSVDFEKVALYIHQHLNEKMTLQELSQLVPMSKYHFLRKFTKKFHLTPAHYIQAARVSEAKRLLQTSLSISEIAMRAGFYDQSHLTHMFKKHIGMTPSKYQQIYNEEEAVE